eukprot:5618245-Amphidinium_carterae.1
MMKDFTSDKRLKQYSITFPTLLTNDLKTNWHSMNIFILYLSGPIRHPVPLERIVEVDVVQGNLLAT